MTPPITREQIRDLEMLQARCVESLMRPVRERGKMAGWLAPPASGLHGKPVDYEYVKL